MKKKIEVLNIRNTIYPKDSKTNIVHTVKIDYPIDSLTIEFSYSPKKLDDMEKCKRSIQEAIDKFDFGEFIGDYIDDYGTWEDYTPLVNLVTLSVDGGCGEYRGCAHRHINTQTHVISPSFASPGFTKGEIDRGGWKFVINVHAVVTEQCDYQLKVIGSVNDELVCK